MSPATQPAPAYGCGRSGSPRSHACRYANGGISPRCTAHLSYVAVAKGEAVTLTIAGKIVATRQQYQQLGGGERDIGSGRTVIIENQFGAADHDHFGKLLTYAAGYDVSTIIWIAETIR